MSPIPDSRHPPARRRNRGAERGWPAGLLLLCLLAVVPAPRAEAENTGSFVILSAIGHLRGDAYVMDADLQLLFSDKALEALSNGIPLTVRLDIQVERLREYLWNETVADLVQRFRLEFHALSERYIIQNLNTGIVRSFQDLQDALAELGRLRNFPLIAARFIADDEQYQAELEVRLEIEALPPPMRPLAYFSSHWRLSSESYRWPVQP